MKKAYRILALILVLLMLTGCTGGSGNQIIGGNNSPTDPAESTALVQYIPEKVDDSDGLPVLKCVCMVDFWCVIGKDPRKTCQENVINAVNQYLKEIDADFRIQMVMITGMDMNYGMGMDCFLDSRVRDEAADADLLYADFFPERMVEYLEPITDYINGSDAPLSDAVPHESLWFRATLDGDVYGIPYTYNSPETTGWIVKSEVLDKCGLTPEDFQQEYWEMDEVFARIFEVYGTSFMLIWEDNYTLPRVDGHICSIPENVSSDFTNYHTFVASCYGIDTSGDKPTVVNILDTEYIKQLQQATPRYTAAGYTFPNSITKTDLLCYETVYNESPMLRDGKWYIPVGQRQNRYQLYGPMMGITKTSEHKAKAVSFLQLLSEDTRLRDLLCFGEEGVNYTLEDGVGVPIEEKRHDLSFLTPMADFGSFDTWYWRGGPNRFKVEEGEDALEVYRRLMDSSQTLCPLDYRYWFDFTDLEDEIEAVNDVVQLEGASFSKKTPEEYDAWMQTIREAGGDTIQAELQRQLDEWLEKNPGWE